MVVSAISNYFFSGVQTNNFNPQFERVKEIFDSLPGVNVESVGLGSRNLVVNQNSRLGSYLFNGAEDKNAAKEAYLEILDILRTIPKMDFTQFAREAIICEDYELLRYLLFAGLIDDYCPAASDYLLENHSNIIEEFFNFGTLDKDAIAERCCRYSDSIAGVRGLSTIQKCSFESRKFLIDKLGKVRVARAILSQNFWGDLGLGALPNKWLKKWLTWELSRNGEYFFGPESLTFLSENEAELAQYLPFIEEKLSLEKKLKALPVFKKFPIEDIYRFIIDGDREGFGSYAFEGEAGYILGVYKALYFALTTQEKPSFDRYQKLHTLMVRGVKKDSGCEFSLGLRNNMQNFFKVTYLDSDALGRRDLSSFKRGEAPLSGEDCYQVLCRNAGIGELRNVGRALFSAYTAALAKNPSRAERAILHLWIARECELEHFFRDGNGRTSHGDLLSHFHKDEDLPMPLFYDPNILDVNGPESLCYRYIEACYNFRKYGKADTYEKSKEVKSLDSLKDIDPDLLELAEELKPLVQGKSWDEIRERFDLPQDLSHGAMGSYWDYLSFAISS